ncbi:MAG: hypothetical protein KAI16_03020 [Candidatus Pacebacteria bacterium]|nr:hypothetical protein [Candidatus Paceibacterota bacterium]
MNSEKGFIKEIIVIVAVIFVLAYFNLDPQEIWEKILEIWNAFMESLNQYID